MKTYDWKLVKSGDFVHIYKYDNPIKYDFKRQPKIKLSDTPGGIVSQFLYPSKVQRHPGTRSSQNKNTSFRAKKNIKSIFESNLSDTDFQDVSNTSTFFITYTFAENIQDIESANYEFTKYIQRLNYEIFGSKKTQLQYLAVPERQRRGAIHFHVVHIRLPYIISIYDTITRTWGNGFTWTEKIKNLHHLIAYISKYVTKKTQDTTNKKSYFVSRNLRRPTVYKNQSETMDILQQDYEPIYYKVYQTEYNIIEYLCQKKI
jgi:hypothetical protein